MKLIVAPRAEAQILLRKRWWRANRPKSPGKFDEELRSALERIARMPTSFPVFSERGGRTVRRCLLSKASCHLYFEVVATAGEVWILAANGAAQKRGPRITKR